jgi:alpha-1,2-mannosyltransferase
MKPIPVPVRLRIAAACCLLVIVAVSAVQQYDKSTTLSRLGTETKTAFLRWRPQILGDETPGRGAMPGLMKGDDVYRLYNYPNPPILGLTLWPLAELPATGGAMLWFALKVGMAGLIFLWAFRLCGPMPDWAKFAAIGFSLHPILGDLSHGNVNIYIAFLGMAALELYRRGWDFTSGIVLALAIACKITPALFVPYFGWKMTTAAITAFRSKEPLLPALWNGGAKVLLGGTVGLGIWLFVVPGSILGWKHNLVLLESWYDVMAKPFLVEGKITSVHENQSIPGLAVRLLTEEPSSIDYAEDFRPVPGVYHTVVNIGPENARLLIRVCQAIWVGVLLWLGWANAAKRGNRTGLQFAAECSYVFLGMLLFSERTWKHHATILVLPFAAILAFAAAQPIGRGLRNYFSATLGAVLLLMIVPSVGPKDFQDNCLAYGTHTALFLLLIAAIAVVMRSTSALPQRLVGDVGPVVGAGE